MEIKSKSYLSVFSQVMKGNDGIRDMEDLDSAELSFAEVKAIASGNPMIVEKMEVDNEIVKLNTLKTSYKSNIYRMQDELKYLPNVLITIEQKKQAMKLDQAKALETIHDDFKINIGNKTLTDQTEAGKYIKEIKKDVISRDDVPIATYRGFTLKLKGTVLYISGNNDYEIRPSLSHVGTISNIDNALEYIEEEFKFLESREKEIENKLEIYRKEIDKPFEHEKELEELLGRKHTIDAALDMVSNPDPEEIKAEENQEIQGEPGQDTNNHDANNDILEDQVNNGQHEVQLDNNHQGKDQERQQQNIVPQQKNRRGKNRVISFNRSR